jgi:hypothetical protein
VSAFTAPVGLPAIWPFLLFLLQAAKPIFPLLAHIPGGVKPNITHYGKWPLPVGLTIALYLYPILSVKLVLPVWAALAREADLS